MERFLNIFCNCNPSNFNLSFSITFHSFFLCFVHSLSSLFYLFFFFLFIFLFFLALLSCPSLSLSLSLSPLSLFSQFFFSFSISVNISLSHLHTSTLPILLFFCLNSEFPLPSLKRIVYLKLGMKEEWIHAQCKKGTHPTP